VWTNSTIVPKPVFDSVSKTWTVRVNRDGNVVQLHPAHIVIAAGTLGSPNIPKIANKDLFKGETLHANKYRGGKNYTGKRVAVIGAGNTSADICQDLSFCGASSVTMVQRSSTCVVSSEIVMPNFLQAFPDGVPHEISDFDADGVVEEDEAGPGRSRLGKP
jgi:cation diffusion facilitator CzcD-associated flavoprotein CzcO